MNVGNEVRSFKLSRNASKTTYLVRGGLVAAVLLNILFLPLNLSVSLGAAAADAAGVSVWWPTQGSHMEGTQPFKALLTGVDNSQYQMYWQVDGGQLNSMQDATEGGAHKEASVDVNSWTWRGSGPYTVNFVAQENGQTVAEQSEEMYVDNGLPTQAAYQPAAQQSDPSDAASSDSSSASDSAADTSASSATQSVSVETSQSSSDASSAATLQIEGTSVNVSNLNLTPTQPISVMLYNSAGAQVASGQLQPTDPSTSSTPQISAPQAPTTPVIQATVNQSSGFYVDPDSEAAEQAQMWQVSDPTDAALMDTLAAQPTAEWFGDWNTDIQSDVESYVDTTSQAGKTAVLVAYNIPDRDCGGYSQGGAENESDYISWIGGFARGIGDRSAIVILEPDALAGLDCLSSSDQSAREQMLSSAVSILKSNPNTKVYLDAGNPTWQSAQTMATRLEAANIGQADGFSLNVSNFQTTAANIAYGEQIAPLVGGKHFVVDTSRNGSGSNGQWCNPNNATVGDDPTTQTGNSLVDAFLWIKVPGESDGTCNGAPAAGVWWPQYAVQLAK